ncbi:ROK family transcriptional regulator [Actinotalea sp. M2MS4P-6]|uniref:ROK family transcriptional regulator n=1 Tax=Actinotalea sp. M2MS4P-6 TaxID=2983762 RepID=UPI0021E50874|nr:ROK family transcriptional regulator [Actinotalea sp. M2MS4P-6]MCV2396000.1 ROK family transcriptional regulator [Actinotalea sp. M2MS4P-6]
MPAQPARGDLVPSSVLGLLGTRGPLSRAQIARELAISPATVTQTTKALLARGLVRELDQVPSLGGRPARLLGLVSTGLGAIGAKVTADHVAVVHVALDGSVDRSSVHPFDPDAPDALDALGNLLRAAVRDYEGQLLGVGVGIPGAVDGQASGSVEAPTLGWSEAPVGRSLRAALGVPVLVENDVNTLAVAERVYGIGREHGSYLVATIGRGIGCGIVIDGALYRGAFGGAGEIGHIPMSVDGPECACGSRGCLEAHIGQAALERTAVERRVIGEGAGVEALHAAADAGDAVAAEVLAEAGAMLGRALAGVVHTLDPEVVVMLGEGISAWRHWEAGFAPSFRRHLMPSRRGTSYLIDSWDEDKWALGAAALVLASPFDQTGATGDQGSLVRERLHAATGQA